MMRKWVGGDESICRPKFWITKQMHIFTLVQLVGFNSCNLQRNLCVEHILDPRIARVRRRCEFCLLARSPHLVSSPSLNPNIPQLHTIFYWRSHLKSPNLVNRHISYFQLINRAPCHSIEWVIGKPSFANSAVFLTLLKHPLTPPRFEHVCCTFKKGLNVCRDKIMRKSVEKFQTYPKI